MANQHVVVGHFEITDDALLGPKAYMEAQGDTLLAAILDGTDLLFQVFALRAPNIETAILTRLQTDYAGWKGARDLHRQVYGREA